MPNLIKRYFDSLDDAIKTARNRAHTDCTSHYVYKIEAGFFISRRCIANLTAYAKVKFDGTVERLNQEEAAK